LGTTSAGNYAQLQAGHTGIRSVNDPSISIRPVVASAIPPGLPVPVGMPRFEALCSLAIKNACRALVLPPERTLFVLSTTKGNIDLLETEHAVRVPLHVAGASLANAFGFKHSRVVSNACISGVQALLVAQRSLASGHYEHAVVVGGDILSHFVVSGFQSLQALSAEPCRPFDAARTGLTLGEAAAVMVLSARPEALGTTSRIQILGGGVSNDANHISGPSRTGEELAQAIGRALVAANVSAHDIDFISAHGTATRYNDEMEAKAFIHAGVQHAPVNSLKGYYGHTLGAAGIVETIVSIHSMLNGECLPTFGYTEHGVSSEVTVCARREARPMNTVLKTASGFGGCNAAIVLQKTNV
jgi:3-oxoacyl-[acyl-carrier-protein] synthase-1